MKKIIYYIATSMDGYISGENDDVSGFLYQGKGVEKYQTDLTKFKTVIMGRNTYEMGYAFNLQAGQPAYQGMEHFIFSDNLILENLSNTVHIEKLDIDRIKAIRQTSPTDIYMCGGGVLAGWLLNNNQIDQIKVKINPIVLGKGTKLFENLDQTIKLKLVNQEFFDDGMIILTYYVLKK